MARQIFQYGSAVQNSNHLTLIRIVAVFGLLLACSVFSRAHHLEEQSDEDVLAGICQNLQNATVRIVSNNDRSSGVVVTEAGHILTVAHGLHGDSKRADIVFYDGSKAVAEILFRDKTLDVAVLKLLDDTARPKLNPIAIVPQGPLRKEAMVLAAGYPGREPSGLHPVIRLGELLAVEPTTLRSSCTLTAGDSGGPLVNHQGQLIGLHRQIGLGRESNHHLPMQRIESAVKSVVDLQKLATADSSRPNELTANLPIPGHAVTETLRMRRVKIYQTKGTPQDDAVPQVSGTLLDASHVATKLSELTPNAPILCRFAQGNDERAEILASDAEQDLVILKLQMPRSAVVFQASEAANSAKEFSMVYAGISEERVRVGLISRRHHDEPGLKGRLGAVLDIDESSRAVRVKDVAPNSTAFEAGLVMACLIDSVNDRPVSTLDDVGTLLSEREPGDWLQFRFRVGNESSTSFAQLRHDPAEQFERTEFLDGRSGVVSERRSGFRNVIQHDIELSPKDCGGPLVDRDGQVIGMSIARRGRESSLAIPVESVFQLLDSAKPQRKSSKE